MTGREDVFQKAMNEGHSAAWDQTWEKAAASYQAALEEFPDHPKALNSLGLALFQLQKVEEALEVYKRVAGLTPQDPIPVEKIAQLSERLGNINDAIKSSLQAAELQLRMRDVDKAVENWVRVTMLNPDHALARSRLALAHERLGHTQQAVTEYLAVASILQRSGNLEKAVESVAHALKLKPDSAEARQAQALLKTTQLLPKPVRPKGGTAPLRMAQVKEMEAPKPAESGKDPVSEARQKALKTLAEVLFEHSDQSEEAQARRGLQAIMRGGGAKSAKEAEQTRIMLHIGQAIDAQTRNQDAQAIAELERALEAGLEHPALFFDLGLLNARTGNPEAALRHFTQSVRHDDFNMAAHLMMGQVNRELGKMTEASVEYLEALKQADSIVVEADKVTEMRQLYEPLIDAQSRDKDEARCKRLCDNIHSLLMRPNWRNTMLTARAQLPKPGEGRSALPLAEVIIQTQSSQVLEAMNTVNQLVRVGKMRSAMDEAFQALTYAPSYLPLHTLIGDMLVRDERVPDAVAKYSVVAEAYSVRGEAAQATSMLRKIIELTPMELNARRRLIDQLAARGLNDDAIREYLELAELYYRLAELDMARKTYTTALRFAQQANVDRSWSVQILTHMADIDMQRLDWKQALRVYEQIRTLRPDQEQVRKYLIDLHLRLGQQQQAWSELESYKAYLESTHREKEALGFLEELVESHPDQMLLRRALAEQYHRAGRIEAAVTQLDAIGDALMQTGNRAGVIEVVKMILSMNPPNAEEYRALLAQLQSG